MKRETTIEDVILCLVAAVIFTWFSVSSMLSGELQMGTGATNQVVFEKDDSLKDFWVNLSFFFLVSLCGWALFVWQGIRYFKQKRKK